MSAAGSIACGVAAGVGSTAPRVVRKLLLQVLVALARSDTQVGSTVHERRVVSFKRSFHNVGNITSLNRLGSHVST